MRQVSSNNNVEMLKISPDLNVAFVTDPRARRQPLVTTLTPRHSALHLFVKSLRIIFMMTRDLMTNASKCHLIKKLIFSNRSEPVCILTTNMQICLRRLP